MCKGVLFDVFLIIQGTYKYIIMGNYRYYEDPYKK
jgi:hypothetical protein